MELDCCCQLESDVIPSTQFWLSRLKEQKYEAQRSWLPWLLLALLATDSTVHGSFHIKAHNASRGSSTSAVVNVIHRRPDVQQQVDRAGAGGGLLGLDVDSRWTHTHCTPPLVYCSCWQSKQTNVVWFMSCCCGCCCHELKCVSEIHLDRTWRNRYTSRPLQLCKKPTVPPVCFRIYCFLKASSFFLSSKKVQQPTRWTTVGIVDTKLKFHLFSTHSGDTL